MCCHHFITRTVASCFSPDMPLATNDANSIVTAIFFTTKIMCALFICSSISFFIANLTILITHHRFIITCSHTFLLKSTINSTYVETSLFLWSSNVHVMLISCTTFNEANTTYWRVSILFYYWIFCAPRIVIITNFYRLFFLFKEKFLNSTFLTRYALIRI